MPERELPDLDPSWIYIDLPTGTRVSLRPTMIRHLVAVMNERNGGSMTEATADVLEMFQVTSEAGCRIVDAHWYGQMRGLLRLLREVNVGVSPMHVSLLRATELVDELYDAHTYEI